MALEVEGVKNSKNKPQNTKKPVPEHSRTSFYVILLVLEFQNDL
jgi:hypothetical protein